MSNIPVAEFRVVFDRGCVVDVLWGDKVVRKDVVSQPSPKSTLLDNCSFLTGYVLGFDQGVLCSLAICTTRGAFVAGRGGDIYKMFGQQGCIVLSITIRSVNGKVCSLETTTTKSVVTFDHRGGGIFEEVINKARVKLQDDAATIDALRGVLDSLSDKVTRLRQEPNPVVERDFIIQQLRDLGVSFGFDMGEDVVLSLEKGFRQRLNVAADEEKELQKGFDTWRRVINEDPCQLNVENLTSTRDLTTALLRSLERKILEKRFRKTVLDDEERTLLGLIQGFYHEVTGGEEPFAGQQIITLRTFLLPHPLDKRFGVSDDRLATAHEMVRKLCDGKRKINGFRHREVPKFPSDLEKKFLDRKQHLDRLKFNCEARRRQLLLKIDNLRNHHGQQGD